MSLKISATKKALSIGIGVALSLGLSPAPSTAHAAPASSSLTSVSSTSLLTQLSSSDLKEIETRAQLAGDHRAATSIARYADSLNTNKQGRHAAPNNIITRMAKRALISVLRYGAHKLPPKVRPYAVKIANFLEDFNNFQQGALISALQAIGIPYDVAHAAAYWCVIFLGI